MHVRRHIAAIALLGVHLLQGFLPAVGAACESQPSTARVTPVANVSAEIAPTAHHHHVMADDAAHDHASAGSGGVALPVSAPKPHPHTPTVCPMAMACTVVGVLSASVAVSIVDVAIEVHRPVHAADWPVSLDIAPEPPPPRG